MSLTQRLRQRITIQEVTTATDPATGALSSVWANWLADEPAEVVPLSGREFIQSAATQAGVDTRMTIRYRPGVLTTMRILFDGEIYNVKSVLPDPTMRKHLTLMTQRGVSDGD